MCSDRVAGSGPMRDHNCMTHLFVGLAFQTDTALYIIAIHVAMHINIRSLKTSLFVRITTCTVVNKMPSDCAASLCSHTC